MDYQYHESDIIIFEGIGHQICENYGQCKLECLIVETTYESAIPRIKVDLQGSQRSETWLSHEQ